MLRLIFNHPTTRSGNLKTTSRYLFLLGLTVEICDQLNWLVITLTISQCWSMLVQKQSRPAFTCSKSTIETLKQCGKSAQC